MYCVIQKVTNKKPDPHGEHKELLVDSYTITIGGVTKTKYKYSYGEERFERPVKDAYKISIHKSYRENGKVKKKQWVICTMSYYDILAYWPGDCIGSFVLKEKLEQMGIDESTLWELVYEKFDPLLKQIEEEFQATEEYKAKQKHEEILKRYREDKTEFENLYGQDTYDYCYDIFGTLRNEEYLNQLKTQYKTKQEYQRSYYNNRQSNYNYSGGSSYSFTTGSTYTDEEKTMLKKIYRVAAKNFHPDVTKDDGSMMKFLTKLKEEWGI